LLIIHYLFFAAFLLAVFFLAFFFAIVQERLIIKKFLALIVDRATPLKFYFSKFSLLLLILEQLILISTVDNFF